MDGLFEGKVSWDSQVRVTLVVSWLRSVLNGLDRFSLSLQIQRRSGLNELANCLPLVKTVSLWNLILLIWDFQFYVLLMSFFISINLGLNYLVSPISFTACRLLRLLRRSFTNLSGLICSSSDSRSGPRYWRKLSLIPKLRISNWDKSLQILTPPKWDGNAYHWYYQLSGRNDSYCLI